MLGDTVRYHCFSVHHLARKTVVAGIEKDTVDRLPATGPLVSRGIRPSREGFC